MLVFKIGLFVSSNMLYVLSLIYTDMRREIILKVSVFVAKQACVTLKV